MRKTSSLVIWFVNQAHREFAAAPFFPPPRTVAKSIPNVSKVVAIASGKGGVGKSTTAVNLAVSLATKFGARVGLLDADVYGPSIPTMMKLRGLKPELTHTQPAHLIPLENYGIKCMSMGFLAAEGQAVAWRGPMVGKALDQMLFDVVWGTLDILLIDLPPGTGDTHISLAQRVIIDGAVVVTTPQEVALADVSRSVRMLQQTKTRLLGVVENMSYYVCTCGAKSYLFGKQGGDRIAAQFEIPLLGSVPLDPSCMEGGERGAPIVLTSPDSAVAQEYVRIAELIQASVQEQH